MSNGVLAVCAWLVACLLAGAGAVMVGWVSAWCERRKRAEQVRRLERLRLQ